MKKIKIGVVTNQNSDVTMSDEQKDQWLAQEIAKGSFGKSERWIAGDELQKEEIADAIEQRVTQGSLGEDILEYKFAAEFSVVEEDMSNEIALEAADKVDRQDAALFLKRLRKADLTDLDKCATAIMKIVKHLRADK